MAVLYLDTHRRRPVWVGLRPVTEDVQGQIPDGWCECCGMECFEEGAVLCPECERMEMENGKTHEKPL